MTIEIIQRALHIDAVEIEGAEGRTVHARMLRWDEQSMVSDGGPLYPEVWRRGVFAQSIKRSQTVGRGWPLMYAHDRNLMPIGMVSAVHERSDGPWMTAKISRTSAGDDMVELIRDGAVPGVSVGGTAIKSRHGKDGVVERVEVAIREISMTPFPALMGADELVLRHQEQTVYAPGVLDEMKRFLAELEASD
jgi:HK97 family phage prohead protease